MPAAPSSSSRAGLLAQKTVLRETLLQAAADQHLGIEVRLARHVLRALAHDRERGQPPEVAQRQGAGLLDQPGPDLEPLLQRATVHDVFLSCRAGPQASFHNQAAPRTPLESPWTAFLIGVSNTVENV